MKVKVVVVDLEIPPRVKRWAFRIAIPAIIIGLGTIAYAAVPLTVWTTGQALKAVDLNANFTALNGSFMGLDSRVATLETAAPLVPSGAVMAFDLDVCPSGWSVLPSAQGRTVVGVNADTTNGLSVRTRGQSFGEENHTLVASEMPSHTHTESVCGNDGAFTNNQTGLWVRGGFQPRFQEDDGRAALGLASSSGLARPLGDPRQKSRDIQRGCKAGVRDDHDHAVWNLFSHLPGMAESTNLHRL